MNKYMIKIKMKTNYDVVKEFNACKVLEHLNNTEFSSILRNMDWQNKGKKDFLMDKVSATQAIIHTPLSEKDAEQAIKEYEELGYE